MMWMLTIFIEELGAASPLFNKVARWRSQNSNNLRKVRARLVSFQYRVLPSKQKLALKKPPDLDTNGVNTKHWGQNLD